MYAIVGVWEWLLNRGGSIVGVWEWLLNRGGSIVGVWERFLNRQSSFVQPWESLFLCDEPMGKECLLCNPSLKGRENVMHWICVEIQSQQLQL